MPVKVYAVQQPDLPPLTMPDRFKHEVTYFMTLPGMSGAPEKLGPYEYWIRQDDAARWLDEFVVEIVSPLDNENKTEMELTEEQETWLEWMLENKIEHIRLEG